MEHRGAGGVAKRSEVVHWTPSPLGLCLAGKRGAHLLIKFYSTEKCPFSLQALSRPPPKLRTRQ